MNAEFKIATNASVRIEIPMHDGQIAKANISFDHLSELYRSALNARVDSLSSSNLVAA